MKKILRFIRGQLSDQNPLLLLYHKLIAIAAAFRYGFPSRRLRVIAVTGTKGKSTVVHMLTSILEAAGHKVGVASTIHFKIGETVWPNATKQTTQGRFKLQRLLRLMVREHCDFALVEATSHALVQSRLWGINIDTAVLTNIQNDHLEYHGSFEEYMHAKGLLFSSFIRMERKRGLKKTAILPLEDPNVSYFQSFVADRTIGYGLTEGFVHAESQQLMAQGSRFRIVVPNDEVEVMMPLPGEFNIHNALAATAAALVHGVNLSAIKTGLENELSIPGRLESIQVGQPFSVIVDYAHTEESLDKLLAFFKPVTKGKLWLVFGATGGGRDKSKRPKMGAIGHNYADMIVVTDDDPYTEDRMAIIEQVASGIPREEGKGLWKIRDRRAAIKLALTLAEADDTVVIAGKGCEPIQIIGTERIEWDDRAVAREILSSELEVAL